MNNVIGCSVTQDTNEYYAKEDELGAKEMQIDQYKTSYEDSFKNGTLDIEIIQDLLNEHPACSGEYLSLHNDLIKADSLESISAARDAIVQDMIKTCEHIFQALAELEYESERKERGL